MRTCVDSCEVECDQLMHNLFMRYLSVSVWNALFFSFGDQLINFTLFTYVIVYEILLLIVDFLFFLFDNFKENFSDLLNL